MVSSIAGVVILYNPDDSVVQNIESYAPYLDHLYVIDNSSYTNIQMISNLFSKQPTTYIPHKDNKGIAYSLNEALHLTKDHYQWLLTMDQDSRFLPNSFQNYISCLDKLDSNVYGICPIYDENDNIENCIFKPVEKCITSGNIIQVKIAIVCGGFDENLFIDEVDHEFCYRCNRKGYTLLKYQKRILLHNIGNILHVNLFCFHFTTLNENYRRQYYIYRNKLYVCHKFPELKMREYKFLLIWLAKIILGEPDKIRKLYYIYRDYFLHKLGKYSIR